MSETRTIDSKTYTFYGSTILCAYPEDFLEAVEIAEELISAEETVDEEKLCDIADRAVSEATKDWTNNNYFIGPSMEIVCDGN